MLPTKDEEGGLSVLRVIYILWLEPELGAFLHALCVTRARVASFPLPVPRSRVLFQIFFSRTKICIPAFLCSKFCNAFQFRVLKKKMACSY